MPSPTSPAPSTSTRRPSSDPSRCAATATAADDTDTACRPMAVSVRDALADLDRLAEHPRQQRAGRALALGRQPRLADLAEDLALADDHRVDAGRHPEQVRDRGVVVVRVQVVGDRRRDRRADWSVRKSRTSSTAGWNVVQRA